MDLDKILSRIALENDIDVKDVIESKVDKLFPSIDSEERYLPSLRQLLEYVENNLGKDYRFEYRALNNYDDMSAPDWCVVSLIKKLRSRISNIKDHDIVEKYTLETDVMTLDFDYVCDEASEEVDSFFMGIRSIGDILNKVKVAYDAIENYILPQRV